MEFFEWLMTRHNISQNQYYELWETDSKKAFEFECQYERLLARS